MADGRVDIEEPLLQREEGGDEGGRAGRLKNVVDFRGRSEGASSSVESTPKEDPTDIEIKEQIRDMQNNFLVRMSMTMPPQGTEVDDMSRSPGFGRRGGQRTGKRKSGPGFVSLSSFRDGAQSVLGLTKSRGTVALLSFHVILTAIWATLGACYYIWRLDWTFSGAIYFIFQAGYGVGFGGPLELNKGPNHEIPLDVLYFTTIVVCLIGSLSVFSLYAFFFHEFQLHSFQSHLDKESKSAFVGEKNKKKKMAAYLSRSFHWLCGGWLNDLCGWQLPAVAYATLMMLLVMFLGVGIGMGYEDLTFHESIYFTISTVQTSGLAVVKENPRSFILVTLLVVVGVPTYAAFCSLLLERITRPYTTRLRKKMMRHRFATHDNVFLQNIRSNRSNINNWDGRGGDDGVKIYNSNILPVDCSSGSGMGTSTSQMKATSTTRDGLNWTEYLEVELMRLGILEMETLQTVWENFCNMSMQNK